MRLDFEILTLHTRHEFNIARAAAPPERRKTLLAGKVEDMLNTVVRQIAMFEFERRVGSSSPC